MFPVTLHSIILCENNALASGGILQLNEYTAIYFWYGAMVLWFNFLKITLADKSRELRYERDSERGRKEKWGINYREHNLI